MRTRKALLSAAALLGLSAFLVGGATAQDSAPGADKPAGTARQNRGQATRAYRPPILRQIDAAKIELTADQKGKLKTLTDKYMEERKALQAKNLEAAEQRKQLMALGRKFRADVLALLTTEQQEQLKKEAARTRRPRQSPSTDKTDEKPKSE